ncbi:hypothetical protein PUV47_01300 [Pseudovibrio exalbescens]|uniref:hypothetical protein n=1 Tax=Pseudovibrio exalbescens TaxID=197461 RepID=UPI002366FD9E|nr:hypothetical protein [Pseudovibrio exalbescens]MDD7908537.1 hypothetical protein [Pseudovibrio exalbescens]
MNVALNRQLRALEVWFREYTKHGEPFSQESADAFLSALGHAIDLANAQVPRLNEDHLKSPAVVLFPVVARPHPQSIQPDLTA